MTERLRTSKRDEPIHKQTGRILLGSKRLAQVRVRTREARRMVGARTDTVSCNFEWESTDHA